MFRYGACWTKLEGMFCGWLPLLFPSVRSVTLRPFGVAGLQRPGQSPAASHSGRSLVNPPARCLHLLLCKTPTAEDAATAGYRGESQTITRTGLMMMVMVMITDQQ